MVLLRRSKLTFSSHIYRILVVSLVAKSDRLSVKRLFQLLADDRLNNKNYANSNRAVLAHYALSIGLYRAKYRDYKHKLDLIVSKNHVLRIIIAATATSTSSSPKDKRMPRHCRTLRKDDGTKLFSSSMRTPLGKKPRRKNVTITPPQSKSGRWAPL